MLIAAFVTEIIFAHLSFFRQQLLSLQKINQRSLFYLNQNTFSIDYE